MKRATHCRAALKSEVGNVILQDTASNFLYGQGRLIITLGVDNRLIVDTPYAKKIQPALFQIQLGFLVSFKQSDFISLDEY